MTTTWMLREMKIQYQHAGDAEGLGAQPPLVRDAADIGPTMLALLGAEVSEVFLVVCLSTIGAPIGYHVVSRGTLDGAPVHPREVFKVALLANASRVILAHNHPSGDPTPSQADIAITRRLRCAGDLLGIPVVDHLVIGDQSWRSLRHLGLL